MTPTIHKAAAPMAQRNWLMTVEDARWWALLLDTEGSITVHRVDRARRDGQPTYSVRTYVGNTCLALLEEARRLAAGNGVIRKKPGWNVPIYHLSYSGPIVAKLLSDCLPHFIVKKRQAILAVYMQNAINTSNHDRSLRRGWRRAPHLSLLFARIHHDVSALNRFGDPDISYIDGGTTPSDEEETRGKHAALPVMRRPLW